MPSAIERVLELLVKEGLLTREQADDVLRSRDGKSSVTDLIVSKGYADPARLSMTLLTLKALSLVCPKCRVRHVVKNIRLDGAYACKRCGGPLEAEDAVPSGTGPVAKVEDPTPPDVLEARKDPKRVIGKYTLLRELGRGGMAVVYQAWDASLAQHVALKLIKSSDLGLPDEAESGVVAEFLREARTAARLQHPNIVRIYEVGSHEGRHFLSMEFVEGRSLAQLLRPEGKGSRIPAFHAQPRRFLVILRDVALALDHAHRNQPPIVHRDVKPQNVLVDAKGRACLVDFGLAKEMRGGGRLTVSGVTKGTPCYMSPEQALGKHGEIDGRTDVWGLGATLYEILAGRPPFEGPTERDILNRVIHEDPRRPSEVLRTAGIMAPVHPELETIALKCLEKDPARRYAGAAAFAREMDRYLAGEGVEARAVTPVQRAIRWASRRKPLVAAVGAAVLMGIVALVSILREGGRTRIVERVVVEKDPSAGLSAAALEIERQAMDFQFEKAIEGYGELIAGSRDPAEAGLLRQRLEDLRLQQAVLAGLVQRIQKGPKDYSPFRLKSGPLDPARVLDATAERIVLRHGGRLAEHAWSRVDPRQYVRLVKDYWPDIDGRAALGFGVWCLRRGLMDEAAFAFQKQAAPEAKRYLEELSARSKEIDPGLEDQRLKLLREAEEALAKGDYVISRARFERVLTISPGDVDAAKGLERVAAEEKKAGGKSKTEGTPVSKLPVAPKAEPPAAVESAPPDAGASLVPADAAPSIEYARGRPAFVKAIREGDLRKAADFAPRAGSGALARIRSGLPADATVRESLAEIEGWLASAKAPADLELRRAFDARDLLVLSLAAVEVDASMDLLAKEKALVQLTVNGQVKKGTLERSRGKVFLNETVTSGGEKGVVSWPVTLGANDALDLLKRARARRGVTPDWRALLGDSLQAVYETAGTSFPTIPAMNAALEAAGADRPKLRADDWLRLWQLPPTWTVDLLAPAARPKWSRKAAMVEFDSTGALLLKAGADVQTAFEGGKLEPGMRLEVRFRVEEVQVKDQGVLRVALLSPEAGRKWKWREEAYLHLGGGWLHLGSYPDGYTGGAINTTNFSHSPYQWLTLSFDLGSNGITLWFENRKVRTVPFVAAAERRLVLSAYQSKVRLEAVRLVGLTEEPAEAAPVADPPAAPVGGYDAAIRRASDKRAAKDFKGAIEEYTRALAERPGDAYAQYLRALTCYDLREYDAVVADVDRGLAGDSEYLKGPLLALRAKAKSAKGDRAGAIADYDQAIAQDSKSVGHRRERGSLHYHERSYEKAVVDFTRAMALEPNSGNDHHHRALCHYDTGQWKLAASDYEKAVELGSWNTDYAWIGLWMSRARMGEANAASREIKTYVAQRQALEQSWFRSIVLFLTGGISEELFLSTAASPSDERQRRELQCEACYYAATKRVLAGDTAGAEPLFRKCLETGVTTFTEYLGAQSELEALAGRRPTGAAEPAPAPSPAEAAAAVPLAEYSFSWKDMEAAGVFEERRAPDGTACWQVARALSGGEVVRSYVELKFEAEAGKTYRCWVKAGGCCQETLEFYAQVADLEYADPRQGGKKFAVDPGGTTAFPPKVTAGSLPKTHAQHGGPRLPVSWRWVQVELPAKYAAGGAKRVRILGDKEGFAVRAAVVSSTRTTAPAAAE